jgi:hypothetical protein
MARSSLTVDRSPTEISKLWEELGIEGTLSFRPAPPEWGTVVTLELEGPDGKAGRVLADKLLRQLKSFAETGEVPTTDRNPSARADAAVS